MNRYPSTARGARAVPATPEQPWRAQVRRWMPLADPVSYLMAAAVLAVTWVGPDLLDRVLAHLAGAP